MKMYGAESWSTDYRALIERDDMDLVIIATYPSSHLEIAKACLAAGKHVLCEKPVASNTWETLEFMKVAREAKTKVLIGHKILLLVLACYSIQKSRH